MDFEIHGHSGCSITVCRENGSMSILKSTDDVSYADRLYRQACKQNSFYQQQNGKIYTPKVLEISRNSSSCKIKMEFVYAQNFIEFFEYAGLDQLTTFVTTLLSFLQCEIDRSPQQHIDIHVLRDKYNNIKRQLSSNPAITDNSDIINNIKLLDSIFDRDHCIVLPVGVSHGDLTLSNILFTGRQIYLIDFLDSFIETPLMDIVKLRQDTYYGWSFLMYQRPYDRIRHQIILQYIDQQIVSKFQDLPFYYKNYSLFQLMNFLRVLQYAHEPRIITFLTNVICELIKSYET